MYNLYSFVIIFVSSVSKAALLPQVLPGKVMMIYITGDVHRRFERIEAFCEKAGTRQQDVLIILGDACVNYYGDEDDFRLKKRLKDIPLTLFMIHGNHEERPENIDSYELREWRGGKVYSEKEFPNLLFAKDGEIFDLDGRKTIVIGGAFSVDRNYRISHSLPWFPDEQADNMKKLETERKLDEAGWQIDTVLSHTVPEKYVPREAFLKGVDQKEVDTGMEAWLGIIEKKLDYQKWYAGHFHIEKKIDRLEIMYLNFDFFCHNVPKRKPL